MSENKIYAANISGSQWTKNKLSYINVLRLDIMTTLCSDACWGWQTLTVDVHVPGDVGVAQCVADLTGNRFSKERVIHKSLVGITRHIRDHLTSFSPSEIIRSNQKEEIISGDCLLWVCSDSIFFNQGWAETSTLKGSREQDNCQVL